VAIGQGEAIRHSRISSSGRLGLRVDGDDVSEGFEFGDESAGLFYGMYSTVGSAALIGDSFFRRPQRPW